MQQGTDIQPEVSASVGDYLSSYASILAHPLPRLVKFRDESQARSNPVGLTYHKGASQYLVELSQVDSKASVQLLVGSIGLETNRRGHVIDFALYTFTPISEH